MGMLPGVDTSKLSGAEIDEKILARTEAIVLSMTPKERRKPEILNASRKRRIAAGSGTTIQEVNRLLKQFEQTKQMMKQFSGGLFGKKKRAKRADCLLGSKLNSRNMLNAYSIYTKTNGGNEMVKIRLRRMGAKKAPLPHCSCRFTRTARRRFHRGDWLL